MRLHGAPDNAQFSSADFDRNSGSLVERLLFNNRVLIVALCALMTVALGIQATRLQMRANFERMIPVQHPFVVNYFKHAPDLRGLGNVVRIAVSTDQATIFSRDYLETLKQINDAVFLIPGVDRSYMKSLWTSTMRWLAVTEDGLDGGPIIPPGYDGSAAAIEQLRLNVERSGEIGTLVANNWKSSIIQVPLETTYPDGSPINYGKLSRALEAVRQRFESGPIHLHITGFAKVVGDLIAGMRQILAFFAGAVAIAALVLYWFTRCVRSTLLVVACSAVAVIWLLGILTTTGYDLDPYSVLVPFLVFAIGMSHGAQKMNGIMQDIGRGTPKLIAARFTFRRLFLAGLTALLADAVGFAALMVINIEVIRDLAVTASIGVFILIFTNLALLPILLSFTGVSLAAARRSLASETGESGKNAFWHFLDLFTESRWSRVAALGALALGAVGFLISLKLQVGDLDPGAPELRAESRYNTDNTFIRDNYTVSSDVLVIMVTTPDGQCAGYRTLSDMDRLEYQLQRLQGVESTSSFAGLSKQMAVGLTEGNPKWYELVRNQGSLNEVLTRAPRELYNQDCNLLPVYVYLADHRASTIGRVVDAVESFAARNDTGDARFLLAAGNAGIEAATNAVVEKANLEMLALVYAAVTLLCFLTFRSWRAVVCAVLPLMLTSVLCEALMVGLGIGVKVATLPVIALGVGIGVDYALYILTVTLARMRAGESLSDAYYSALLFTGRVVVLTGITLALGVATWAFSPIKFQADMGILLAFMFIWNMLGALILLPALLRLFGSGASQKIAMPQASAPGMIG